jgi:dipeptidase
MDYGTHIWVALQRAANATEAISVIAANLDAYGWASEGESFSIADPHEVWLMEIVGKGANETGAVWVARKIPDGAVTGHANQARIRTFPQDDPATCRFSPDVIDFARKQGLFSGADADFSFSDTFDPVGFTGARLAEIRVWNFFHQVADNTGAFEKEYLDYVSGRNTSHRMPLWIFPYKKVSLNDTIWFMRSHFEGTAFDMTRDVGAEEWAASIRTRPLYWEAPSSNSEDPQQYHNERPIGVQQTGWNFVAQMRSWLPDPVGGVVWFSVDDTAHSVRAPFYVGITKVPPAYADEGIQHVDDTRAGETVDTTKAFWAFNIVANFVYTRWADAHPFVQERIVQEEGAFFKAVAKMDAKAAAMLKKGGNEKAVAAMLTSFSGQAGESLVARWMDFFYRQVFFRFRDRFTVSPAPTLNKDPHKKHPDYPWPSTNQQGMKAAWRARVIKDTGDQFKVPAARGGGSMHEERKRSVLGL